MKINLNSWEKHEQIQSFISFLSLKLNSTFSVAGKILYENVKQQEALALIRQKDIFYPLSVHCCYRNRSFIFRIANEQALLSLSLYFQFSPFCFQRKIIEKSWGNGRYSLSSGKKP